jgi:hypothetical protein
MAKNLQDSAVMDDTTVGHMTRHAVGLMTRTDPPRHVQLFAAKGKVVANSVPEILLIVQSPYSLLTRQLPESDFNLAGP